LIPASQLSTSIIFLKATAGCCANCGFHANLIIGMRILPKDVQEVILEKVRGFLATSPFVFEPAWATIISGVNEGIFGWISINSLLESLGTQNTYGALGFVDLF
jgi:Golgi nucleoside diphosphatase